MDYVRDGDAIYKRSFGIIRDEADLSRFAPEAAEVVVRMIHACGYVGLAEFVDMSADFVGRATAALTRGANILCDSEMVASGITRATLPAANAVLCTLRAPEVAEWAKSLATTRSAAAVDLWRGSMGGALIAIGNAPTALFRLLELLDSGAPKPAAILGIPVGFVGAAESKAELVARSRGVAYLTVRGRLGGSAIVAAAINALARLSQ
jgi:precorrin-8X/cobalt-precorrin-8 methylmutase